MADPKLCPATDLADAIWALVDGAVTLDRYVASWLGREPGDRDDILRRVPEPYRSTLRSFLSAEAG
jgi:hypothetical protein